MENYNMMKLGDHPCNLCNDAYLVSGPREWHSIFKCSHGYLATVDHDESHNGICFSNHFATESEARVACENYLLKKQETATLARLGELRR